MLGFNNSPPCWTALRKWSVCGRRWYVFCLVRARRSPTLRGMTPARIAPDSSPFSIPPMPREMQSFAADVEGFRTALLG